MPEERKLPVPENLEALLDEIQAKNDPAINVAGSVNRYLEMKAREKGVPIHGMFELTPLCNLDCKMCYVHLTKEQMCNRKLLTVDQWKSLIDQAVDAGMISANLTGGECLIYPGFEEVFLYLQKKGIRVGILTNGILLDNSRISFFEKHRPRGIQITLYGSDEDEYYNVTGSRCFGKVLEGIHRAKQAGIPVVIGITPNRFLYDGGRKLVAFAETLGIPYTINTSLFTPREETGRKGTLIDIDTDDYISLQLLRRELNADASFKLDECDIPEPSKRGILHKGLLCGAGRSSFFVSWNGSLMPCGAFDEYRVSLLEHSFISAWGKVNDFVKNYPIPEECSVCAYRSACPSCVLIHKEGAEKGHASPLMCDRAKKYYINGLVDISVEDVIS